MGQIFPFLHWDFFCFCVWIVCLCTAPVQYVFIRNFWFFFSFGRGGGRFSSTPYDQKTTLPDLLLLLLLLIPQHKLAQDY